MTSNRSSRRYCCREPASRICASWLRCFYGRSRRRTRSSLPLLVRRADQRNCVALIAAVNSKIAIDSHHAVFEMHLAHPDQAQVGEIWFAVGIALCQRLELRQMIVAIEGECHELLFDEFQYRGAAA